MLQNSTIYAKYKKWIEGIRTLNAKIKDLEAEKQEINDKINDDIEESPAEMVEIHMRLHAIDKEIESAKAVKAELLTKKPFTKEQFINAFNEHIIKLNEKLKDPLEKAIQARAALREALSEYLKAHQEYSAEYARERARWESFYREVDDDNHGHFHVFRRLKEAEYLKSSLFEEFKRGRVLRGDNLNIIEVLGE